MRKDNYLDPGKNERKEILPRPRDSGRADEEMRTR